MLQQLEPVTFVQQNIKAKMSELSNDSKGVIVFKTMQEPEVAVQQVTDEVGHVSSSEKTAEESCEHPNILGSVFVKSEPGMKPEEVCSTRVKLEGNWHDEPNNAQTSNPYYIQTGPVLSSADSALGHCEKITGVTSIIAASMHSATLHNNANSTWSHPNYPQMMQPKDGDDIQVHHSMHKPMMDLSNHHIPSQLLPAITQDREAINHWQSNGQYNMTRMNPSSLTGTYKCHAETNYPMLYHE